MPLSEKMNTRLAYLFAIGIPLLLVFFWHYQNTFYPRADGASYYEVAQDIYLTFQNNGFRKGIEAAYLMRGGRPVFFPVVAVPFIALSGGNIHHAVALTLLFIFFIFLTYAYLLAREYVSPFQAAISTIFLGTLTWIVKFACIFWAELALIACALAAVYHLKKADFFSCHKHSLLAGIWLGFGFLMRPIEFFLAIFLPVIFFVITSYKKNQIKKWDVIITAVSFFLSCALLATVVCSTKTLVSNLPAQVLLITLILFITGSFLFRNKCSLNQSYFFSVLIVLTIVLVWWMPGIKALYAWLTVLLTVSPQFYHLYGSMNPLQAVALFFSHLGGCVLLIHLILFLLLFSLIRVHNKILWQVPLVCFFVSLLMIFPPVVMLALTADIDLRRAMPGFALLQLAACVFAIYPNYALKNMRLFIVSAIVFVQVFTFSCHVFGVSSKAYADLLPFAKCLITPPANLGYENPGEFGVGYEFPIQGENISEQIFRNLKDFHKKDLKLAGYGKIDDSILTVISKKEKSSLRFGTPTYFFSLDEGYNQLSSVDLVLVDVTQVKKSPKRTVEEDPYWALGQDIVKRWEEKCLEEKNIHIASEFFVFNPSEKCQDKILILKILKPKK